MAEIKLQTLPSLVVLAGWLRGTSHVSNAGTTQSSEQFVVPSRISSLTFQPQVLSLCVSSTNVTAGFYPTWLLSGWERAEVYGERTSCLPPYKMLASRAACAGGSPVA